MKKLTVQIKAGRIKRWHNFPIIGEQTVADHTYGVCQVLRYLYRDDITNALICAALDHDVPEHATGDIPYSAKQDFPEIKYIIDKLERNFRMEHDLLHGLSEEEKAMLKWADLAEMAFFAIQQWGYGNKSAVTIVENVLCGLPEIPGEYTAQARNILDIFEEFISDCK